MMMMMINTYAFIIILLSLIVTFSVVDFRDQVHSGQSWQA